MPTISGAIVLPGQRVLPFDGGYLDQPACVLDSFHIMDAAAAAIPVGDGGEE